MIPNPWDVGSTLILTALGFDALATSGAGAAYSEGLLNAELGGERMLAYVRKVVEATDLPVSADLEDGFASTPDGVAETIRTFAKTGICGGSIEDFTNDLAAPIYEHERAVERVAAAVEAARALPGDFVLTARAENYLYGRPDLDDTIERLVAFESAGADVLYAPGLPDLASVREVCDAVSAPVNVLLTGPIAKHSIAELGAAGVARLSVGSSFARRAYGVLIDEARRLAAGDLTYTERTPSFKEIDAFMRGT